MQDVGKVASIATRRVGTALVGDHAVGVSSLFVYDAFDFDETGGEMQVGDTVLAYTGWSTDDDDPDAPDVVMLAAPTAVAFEDGLQVWVLPLSNVTTAAVILDETGEALDDVVVPQHLVPTLLDGVRLTHDATVAEEGVTEVLADAETVTVREDEYGEWEVVSVDRAEAVLDGGLIDPDTTIPPAALTDGLAPPLSPEPSVMAFALVMVVKWQPVANPDLVTYEVHASTDPDFTPTADTLADETPGLLSYVRATEGGGPLAYNTDYYVRIVAKDADGAAAPSPPVVGQASQVGLSDIMAGSITAEMLEAVLVLASTIKLGDLIDISAPSYDDEGKPSGGIVVWDPANPSGEPLVRLHPGGSSFRGELVTDLLTVMDTATIVSSLLLGSGSVTELQNGVPNPTAAPALSLGPESVSSWPAVPAGYVQRGITWDADEGAWWRLLWNGSSKRVAIQRVSTGGVASSFVNTQDGTDFVTDVSSIVRYGSQSFVITVLETFADGRKWWQASRYNFSGSRVKAVPIFTANSIGGSTAVGNDETTGELLVAYPTLSTNRIAMFSMEGVNLTRISGYCAIDRSTSSSKLDLRSAGIGSFDFGTPQMWAAGGRENIFGDFPGWPPLSDVTTYTPEVAARYFATDGSISGGGVAWKATGSGSSRFYSTSNDQVLTRWGNYVPDGDNSWTVRYADTASGGTTAASPARTVAVPARRQVTATLPPAPTGVTSADVFVGYAASGAATTLYKRSEALAASRSMVLLGKSTTGSTALPTENTMGGDPAMLRSASQGSAYDQGWALLGNGLHHGIAPQAGSVTATVPANGTADVAVTFAVPFSAPPIVNTTVVGSSSPWLVASSPRDVTATGFTLRIGRDAAGSATHTANWTATLAR